MEIKALSTILIIIINSISMIYPQKLLISLRSKNEEGIKIVDKIIESKDKYVDINVKIPQISGLKNKDKEAQINEDIVKWTEGWIEDIKLIAKENLDSGLPPTFPYEAYAVYKIKNNDKNILSFYIDYYQYTGGAHGITTRKPYNIDVKSGGELKIMDLFQSGYNYKDIINKEIKNEIDKNKEMYFEGKEGFQGIKDEQNFYIEGNNLVVYFGQYEIAPYVAGMPEFRIPLELFKNGYVYDRIRYR